ncbi:melanocortin receptor 5-like [Montipora capricornis]|uniref:melanocortin receptor 5-like n=1 Tax=Montipora capricornis TaxID=246305 RepID=UPI0035F1F545
MNEPVMRNFQGTNDFDLQNRTSNFESFSASECISLLTVLGIEAVAIVTLNALAIIVFLKEQSLRGKRSMYLTISLAVADMFVACTLTLWMFSLGNGCNIWTIKFLSNPIEITGALVLYFPAVSMTNLTAISLERMHATFRPFKHRLVKKKMFGAAVVAVWLTAGLFTVIDLSTFNFDIGWNHTEAPEYPSFIFCCPFIILVSYTSIAIKFYCGTHPQRHGAISRERKLTKTLFFVTIVSLLLLLPALIANFLLHVTIFHQTIQTLEYLLTFLFCANSFINPVLYAFRMPEFKRALVLLLCCRSRSGALQVFPLYDMSAKRIYSVHQ